ncbi:hypothetical protein UACE39S_00783 [Ureibacillus acetophenoni]
MKKLLSAIFTLALAVLVVGCSSPETDELLNYINEEMLPLADKEEEIINEYDSVTGANYIDDYTTFIHLSDVVTPLYQDFIAEIESINFESSEIRDVHEIFIDAHNTQYNGIIKMISALENQDYDLAIEANEMLEEGRAGMRDYQYELQELAEKYNVEIQEK